MARQLDHLRNPFAHHPGLPYADLLPDDTPHLLGPSDDPVDTPVVTLGLFLGQILDPEGSCRPAVARLLAHRACTGQPAVSANTGGVR